MDITGYIIDVITAVNSVIALNSDVYCSQRRFGSEPNFLVRHFFFFSTSVPKGLSYPATAPSLNIKEGNDYSAVNVSAVGPTVETTFEVRTVICRTVHNAVSEFLPVSANENLRILALIFTFRIHCGIRIPSLTYF